MLAVFSAVLTLFTARLPARALAALPNTHVSRPIRRPLLPSDHARSTRRSPFSSHGCHEASLKLSPDSIQGSSRAASKLVCPGSDQPASSCGRTPELPPASGRGARPPAPRPRSSCSLPCIVPQDPWSWAAWVSGTALALVWGFALAHINGVPPEGTFCGQGRGNVPGLCQSSGGHETTLQGESCDATPYGGWDAKARRNSRV